MKKNNIFIFLMFIFVLSIKVNAQPRIIIDGNNKRIADEKISAVTVKEALDLIAKQKNIEVIYSQSGSRINLYSVDGIKNNDLDKNAIWLGYIIRDDILVSAEYYLELNIQPDDYVYLYYGDKNTQKISRLDFKSDGSIVNFELKDEHLENEKIVQTPIAKQAKLSIKLPDGTKKILITDNKGRTYSKLDNMGIYEVLVSSPNQMIVPSVVNFGPLYFFHGLKDKEATRGEFIKFVVDKLVDFKAIKSTNFIDLKSDTPYANEIKKATEMGIIIGYGDNTVRPNNKITLLEATLILSSLLDNNTKINSELQNLPDWAKQKVTAVLESKLLDNIELDFNKYLTDKDLTAIYNNYIQNKNL